MNDFLGQPNVPVQPQASGYGTQPSLSYAPQAPMGPPKKSGQGFDFKQYFHIVVKRIWLVALCFVIALGVMVVILVRQVPVYRAQATLLLSQGVRMPKQLSPTEERPLRGADYLETQKRIIMSSMILQRARERLS
ncbi:MAG: Wzz/FepE/Etk N-terminal domain-containing protein, partial [Verrucomicrobiota bacterium]